MHAQTKHFDLHHHYVREKFDDGTITVDYVPSHSQQADIFEQNHSHLETLFKIEKMPASNKYQPLYRTICLPTTTLPIQPKVSFLHNWKTPILGTRKPFHMRVTISPIKIQARPITPSNNIYLFRRRKWEWLPHVKLRNSYSLSISIRIHTTGHRRSGRQDGGICIVDYCICMVKMYIVYI